MRKYIDHKVLSSKIRASVIFLMLIYLYLHKVHAKIKDCAKVAKKIFD